VSAVAAATRRKHTPQNATPAGECRPLRFEAEGAEGLAQPWFRGQEAADTLALT